LRASQILSRPSICCRAISTSLVNFFSPYPVWTAGKGVRSTQDSRWQISEHEDNRPYFEGSAIEFRLKPDVDVPDTTGNEGGAAGGTNSKIGVLPPIGFPTAPIDASGGTELSGALKGMPGSDSCATDSYSCS
jgi:hypothetical protein